MSKILIVSASVLALTFGIAAAGAHQTGQGMMNGNQGYMGQGYPAMMNGHGWGPGMMGYGMMGAGMMDPDMMLIMMDTNGDGTLSLEEFQAMPTRMFNYLDKNKDGQVDQSELDAFHANDDAN